MRDILQIEVMLREKFDEMIKLIPKRMRDRFEKEAYICGGCIYSLRHNQEPNDYDFFIKDRDFARRLLKFFRSRRQVKKCGDDLIRGVYRGQTLLISDYAISIGTGTGKFQIVTKFIGEPYDVVREFDFKHNQFYYDGCSVLSVAAWYYLDGDKLVFNSERPRNMCRCIARATKFLERGMKMSQQEMLRGLKLLYDVGFQAEDIELLNKATGSKKKRPKSPDYRCWEDDFFDVSCGSSSTSFDEDGY